MAMVLGIAEMTLVVEVVGLGYMLGLRKMNILTVFKLFV